MTKSLIINTLIIALVVLLQSTLLQHISFYGILPDLVLIFVLFISLKGGSIKGEVIGFSGGLLLDFLSLSPLGFHCFIYAVIGFLAGYPHRNVTTESILTQFLFVTLGIIIKNILSSLLILVFSINTTSLSLMGRNFFIELLFTLIVTPFLFTFANKLYDLTHRKRMGL
ncbi:MAG: rod shape-determining protein MreD [Spirochaetaceae bacterium]